MGHHFAQNTHKQTHNEINTDLSDANTHTRIILKQTLHINSHKHFFLTKSIIFNLNLSNDERLRSFFIYISKMTNHQNSLKFLKDDHQKLKDDQLYMFLFIWKKVVNYGFS